MVALGLAGMTVLLRKMLKMSVCTCFEHSARNVDWSSSLLFGDNETQHLIVSRSSNINVQIEISIVVQLFSTSEDRHQ